MTNPSTIPRGNTAGLWLLGVTLSPGLIAPDTSAEQTFTVNGLHLGDFVDINKPTSQAGLGIVGVRVAAKDTLAINFINATAATITPTASEAYILQVQRADNLNSAATAPVLANPS